ncbi:MAG: pirin family protein [Hyphomicrobiaceae bacterium]
MREILRTLEAPRRHWVGDRFPVRSLLSPAEGEAVSPLLLLDHAGPHEFAAAGTPRGVGAHPYKGFETVTIVYSGEVAHRDSSGAGGVIGPGDVQWMTVAAGIVHEEFHSEAFTAKGGTFEMV